MSTHVAGSPPWRLNRLLIRPPGALGQRGPVLKLRGVVDLGPSGRLSRAPVSAVRTRGRRGGPGAAPAGHPGQAREAAAAEGHQVRGDVGAGGAVMRTQRQSPSGAEPGRLAPSPPQECGGPHRPGPLRQHGDACGAGGLRGPEEQGRSAVGMGGLLDPGEEPRVREGREVRVRGVLMGGCGKGPGVQPVLFHQCGLLL